MRRPYRARINERLGRPFARHPPHYTCTDNHIVAHLVHQKPSQDLNVGEACQELPTRLQAAHDNGYNAFSVFSHLQIDSCLDKYLHETVDQTHKIILLYLRGSAFLCLLLSRNHLQNHASGATIKVSNRSPPFPQRPPCVCWRVQQRSIL